MFSDGKMAFMIDTAKRMTKSPMAIQFYDVYNWYKILNYFFPIKMQIRMTYTDIALNA